MLFRSEGVIEIESGYSDTYFISYKSYTIFSFKIEPQKKIQINIHGINCNFDINFNGKIMNQINLDTYSIEINSTNNNITITPLIDVINGKYKENYEQKSCPLSINSYIIKDNSNLKIENKEENIIYFEPLNFNILNILYNIKNVKIDSFVALSFQFKQKTNFSINVTYKNDNNEINSIYKNISDSSYIYLNSENLLFNNETDIDISGILSINIENKNEKAINFRFKIIEKDTISLIEKDSLTFGFLTSKTIYQYYYTEIFKKEEGELILHNKRLYGVLHGKIINKKDIKKEDLYNISTYPNETWNETNSEYLNYNQHLLKLNFSYINTSNCLDGCYLLITYQQQQSIGDFPLIGYEYTILSRFWNYTDYISQIIDIPFNEYIIGTFEMGSISHHYYSIYIPDDAEKIIIQIEDNYLDGFYEEGRQIINTMKLTDETNKLELNDNQNILILNVKSLNYSGKIISFAFRSKDYYVDIFSFYYFRILYVRENETLYFPIDSYFGNLCLPELDNNTNSYYCNLIFKNNYNELSTKFVVTSSHQNEYF